jgi:hypothetical protein
LKNHKKVIQYEQAATETGERLWHFFDYLLNGRSDIEDRLSEGGKDLFDALLKQNRKTNLPIHWGGMKILQGEYKAEGLWEWRFFSDGCQQRVIGMFGEKRKQAIFLIGCYHKQKVYTPPNCLDTALLRAKAVRKGAPVRERAIRENL